MYMYVWIYMHVCIGSHMHDKRTTKLRSVSAIFPGLEGTRSKEQEVRSQTSFSSPQKPKKQYDENPGKERKRSESTGMPEDCREILRKKGLIKDKPKKQEGMK